MNLSSTYFDMKMWSRMFAVNVQSVSIQQLNWQVISRCTLTTNSFAVVYVVKTLNINIMLKSTLRDVLLSWDILMHGLIYVVTECCSGACVGFDGWDSPNFQWVCGGAGRNKNLRMLSVRKIIIIISVFIQQQNSTNTVTNVDTNEFETGMTRLIALTVTPVY